MDVLLNREKDDARKSIKMNFFFLVIFWTVVLGGSLWFNIKNTHNNAELSAVLQARTAFEKDVAYRRWNSNMNGVYVPVSPEMLPNPYLKESNCDVTTTTGLKLTKINPAYMTRLVHDIGSTTSGVKGKITSNFPIRPQNIPDEWEAEALKMFEQELVNEVAKVTVISDQKYMRFIRPLYIEESCMSCHASQGYQVGEVRGAISVTVPMDPMLLAARHMAYMFVVSHFVLWTLGIGVFFLTLRMLKNKTEREHAVELKFQLEKKVQEDRANVEKRQALQTFMDFTEALVYLKDTKYRYTMANKNYELLFRPYESLAGRTDDEALLKYQGIHNKIHSYEKFVLNTLQPVHPEEVFKFDDSGKVYTAALFPVLDSNNHLEGVGGIFFNITQRILMEKDMMAAKEEAESANRAKSDFLANVSHEIRTPLNGVIGMAELLLRSRLTEDQASMIATIKISGDTLLSVLNDVLDFSKIENGKISLDPVSFSLYDVIFETIKSFVPVAYKKHIELIVNIAPQIPDYLVGDVIRIRQILLNLLSNAVKFTGEGEIALSVHLLQQEEKTVRLRISVTDTGIGILPEKQKDIFCAFEQADSSTTRKYGGTGLGLAISSRLVALMDSEIHIESKVNFGSTFWFDVSLPLSDQPAPKKLALSTELFKGIRVLAVDDNQTNLRILSDQLKDWEMEVEQAINVDDAISLLTVATNCRKDFSLVLTDLQMFEKDGFNLINEMQSNPFFREIPVVMLSSEGIRDNASMPPTLKTILTKPVRPDDLIKAIASALGIWERFDMDIIQQGAVEDVLRASNISLSVLLVEDMEMNQLVASRMLTDLGHTVVVAENGQRALEILSEEDFDLIFMDIQMPVLDGEQATQEIRKKEIGDPSRKHQPIVAMTAHALVGDREKYIAIGMDDYIAKPVRLSELTEVIGKMIERFFISDRKNRPHVQDLVNDPITLSNSDDIENQDDDILNYDIMSKSFIGNEELTIKSMELYLRDAPGLINAIKDAISRKDSSSLIVSVHTLKGITGYYTNSRPFEACLALEMMGRNHNLTESLVEITHQMSVLVAEIDKISLSMKKYIVKHS